uniref:TAR DNA-binding protein 43 N-terminal domain-containing protein n=1 Tax=Meloidogyne javanica TaxID=6303 RepID=A0A915ME79_MELJA
MAAQYVYVRDPNDGEPVEFTVSNDGTLPVYSINNTFKGFFGLKYNNEATGFKRAVSTDPTNQVFLAPEDGWGNKIYELMHLPNRSASVTPGELPTINSVSKFCFYLKKEVNSNKENKTEKEVKIEVKSCVTRISKRYFATYHHKSHKDFKEGKQVEIFPNEGEVPFKATCKFVNEKWDFILFKSNEDVEGDGPNISQSFYPGERIILYGRAGKNGTLAPQEGIINSTLQYWGLTC